MRVIVRLVAGQKIIAESIGMLRESLEFVLRSSAKQVDFLAAEVAAKKVPPFRTVVTLEIDALRDGD
jgi:hypothetical protein